MTTEPGTTTFTIYSALITAPDASWTFISLDDEMFYLSNHDMPTAQEVATLIEMMGVENHPDGPYERAQLASEGARFSSDADDAA